jgi:hypothetical protein
MLPMTSNPDRLYDLVPAIYRLRDAAQGYPLRALLRVIAEQVNVVESDIAQLYENWFIETCQDWVVPYIGALVGFRTVHDAGEPDPSGSREARLRNRILYPRADVANTVRFRRRKGTLSALEELAFEVSGWPVRIVEWQRLLGVTQNLNYRRLNRGRTVDIRDGDALDQINYAFDEFAHTVDIRGGGIGDLKAFLWRLNSYTVTNTAAVCQEDEAPNCFLFSALGQDTQLFTRPVPANGKSPGELNLPIPISLASLERFEPDESQPAGKGVPYFYGSGKSFAIWTGTPPQLVTADQIVPADLSDWSYRPLPDTVAVDPRLGRFAFPPTQTRKHGVWVSYSYGAAADLGGGEYSRTISGPATYRVSSQKGDFARIADALAQWIAEAPKSAVIEIAESGVYTEQLQISLKAGQSLVLRAADRTRPILRLLDWQPSEADGLSITGESGSWFTLDGILVSGRAIQIDGDMAGVLIRHSTLVPGWGLTCECDPKRPGEPGIVTGGSVGCISIEHSIIGPIEVNRDEVETDPMEIRISDSVVDATDPEKLAIYAPERLCAHAILTIRRATVFGQIQAHGIDLAENSILLGSVLACRRQKGCIRFCYVTPGSKTPRRYECQPDLVEAAVRDLFTKGDLTPQERDALIANERLRVEPEFNSVRYGTPAYCQLADGCAKEIRTGADDESEMGVYHDLFQPQRIANLNARLAEYSPAGGGVQIIFES